VKRVLSLSTLIYALCALPISAIIDTNTNGMSDLWEKTFNNGQLFDANFLPGDDPDHDGWTNEQESATGTNPFDSKSPNGFIHPQTVVLNDAWLDLDGDGIDEFYPEVVSLTWPTIPGKQYTLLCSTNLMAGSWIQIEQATSDIVGIRTYYFPVTQTVSNVLPPDKLFWKIGIEDVDSDGDGLTDAEAHTLGIAPGFTDANANGIPDEWEVAHSGAFAVYPPCLAARVAQNQSSAQSIYLNNDTGNIVNYSVALSGNTGPAYSSRDSLTGNVGYTWEDISASGTLLAVVSNADDASEAVDITGFTFPFYGQNFTQVFVSSNGLLTFGQGSGAFSNSVLPSMSSPGNLIAALWDDLNPYPTGHIYFKQELDRLIVQYQDVARYGGADTCTFQVVLFADGRIQIHYQKVPTAVDSCTVGIQNSSGTSGLEVVHNAPYLVNQMAIEIRPISEFFTVTPLSGVVSAHSTATLSGLFQSLKLMPGVYYANLAVSHDGAGISPQPVTARLEVKNTPSTVALVSPADGLVVMEGQPVNLNTTATDTEGITRVEFYDGGTKLGEVAGNPDGYFFDSNTLSVGSHLFIARVVDVYGAVTDSLPVHLTVLADTDRDGMPDAWEIANGLDPNNPADALEDADQDGYTNLEEFQLGKNPRFAEDSDHDGMPDGWEVKHGLNPTVDDSGLDLDSDGLSNLVEFQIGTIPEFDDSWNDGILDGQRDADGDGVLNADEIANHTNPMLKDTDMDGLSDYTEIYITGTNPLVADTNGDGISDYQALIMGISATAADTDGDGLTNAQELLLGTDPTKADSDGDGCPDGQDAYPLNAMIADPITSDPADTTAPDITIYEPMNAVKQ
jgi:hypothetical protein